MITTIFIIKVILLILHLPQQQVYQSPGVKQEAAYEMTVRWFSLYHVHSKVLDFLSITVWPAYILDFMQYADLKVAEQTQNFQLLLCSPPFNNKELHSDETLLHQESLRSSQK